MKLHAKLRRAAPAVRTHRGHTASRLVRRGLPVATALALVLSALLVGGLFATVAASVRVAVPLLLVGWVAAIGLTFALPLLAVEGVVAVLERLQ